MFYSFSAASIPADKANIIQDVEKRFKFLENIQHNQHLFIFHGPKIPMYGVAFLKQAPLSTLLPAQVALKENEKIWILYNFLASIENDNILECLHHFEWHYENFLTSLYESLINFSLVHQIKEIFTHLEVEDHEDIEVYGKWPFNWKIGLPDEKLLGHLTFNNQSYHRFREGWRNST